MKKIIASAGLIALGTAGLQAAYVPGLTPMETSKPWSVTASLRGFYDDNYLALPSSFVGKKDSFGVEIKPTFGLKLPRDQTLIELDYTYSLKDYFDRPGESLVHYHEFDARVSHKFSERYRMSLADNFVYSQEPSLIDPVTQTSYQTGVNAYRNHFHVALTVDITQRLGLEAGYNNAYYKYLDEGAGSLSSHLDRTEHLINLDLRWQFDENLTGLLGYSYGIVGYNSLEPIENAPGASLASVRDNISHYVYVGAEYRLSTQLSVSGRFGGQVNTYESTGKSYFNPYLNISGTYLYRPGSFVQFGFRHDRAATDLVGDTTNLENVTLDQAASAFYAALTHKITSRITGTLLGQLQYSTFQGGTFSGQTEASYALDLSFDYAFTQHLSAEVGFNYDSLNSNLETGADRSFKRNRVYMGVRASY